MAKRKLSFDNSRGRDKKQRCANDLLPTTDPVNIQTPRDLQIMLAFEQDAGLQVKQKVSSFRLFLDSIAYGKESAERSARRMVLLEYLQSQLSHEKERSPTYLPDIVRTWHFAIETKVESLFASIVAVLALLLKTISSLIDFRECGNNLCRTLLQEDQMKLIDKCLTANVVKEHLISPCLRLLTEIVSFDGGHAARIVFRQREITFKRLDVFLGMRKLVQEEDAKVRKKPPIRNIALRYLYANLRLQNPSAKMYIMAQGRVYRALLENVLEDPPGVILELLGVLKKDVALDGEVPLTAKGRFFNEWTLGRLATLYNYGVTTHPHKEYASVRTSIHSFLLFICTSMSCGVLNTKERDKLSIEESKPRLSSGNDHYRPVETTMHMDDQVQSKSTKLMAFLQTLRPYASTPQSELILAVFRTAPELVSDYFLNKKTFTFDPKATATWIGYSSFLLGTLQLPSPESILFKSSSHFPPSCGSIIDSVVPLPLTQKVMTRCLNQSTKLIKFLSTKILIAAFERFAEVLRIHENLNQSLRRAPTKETQSPLALNLSAEFCSRVPDIEHVVTQFRSCSKENVILQESFARLLALYYEVIPQRALESRVDISATLSTMLQDSLSLAEHQGDDGMTLLQLDHVLEIAHCSPSMQWWHKSGEANLSPFTMLLKLYIDHTRNQIESRRLRAVLVSVAHASQILSPSDDMNFLDVLISSLRVCDDWTATNTVFEFLDNCISRLVKKPVKYYDLLCEIAASADNRLGPSHIPIDLLLVTVMEQWPFLVKNPDAPAVANVCVWVIRYIEICSLRIKQADMLEDKTGSLRVLTHIHDQLKTSVVDETCCGLFNNALKNLPKTPFSIDSVVFTRSDNIDLAQETQSNLDKNRLASCDAALPPGPPREQEDHLELHKWICEDPQDAIGEGLIGELLFCLCSEYSEIRQQALTSVGNFMAKLESSGYSEWQQTYVVLGELVETVRDNGSDRSLPCFAAALAGKLLSVVADPLNLMYEKANTFLHKGPRWNVPKLPSYWVDKILLKPPTNDKAHYEECGWLLDVLLDGLRTAIDFESYRACNIIERLLSLSSSPCIPKDCFHKVIDLLFRCTYIGGSSTLITRCGILSWIASQIAIDNSDLIATRLKMLSSRVYETSDGKRVDKWSEGSLVALLDSQKVSQASRP